MELFKSIRNEDEQKYRMSYNPKFRLYYIFQMLYLFSLNVSKNNIDDFYELIDICIFFVQKENPILNLEIKKEPHAPTYVLKIYNKIKATNIDLFDLKEDKPLSKEKWAYPTWFAIHTLATMLSKIPNEDEKMLYGKIFICMTKLLPCEYCREHLIRNLKSDTIILTKGNKDIFMGYFNNNFITRKDIFMWSLAFHIAVNLTTDKKFSYAEEIESVGQGRFLSFFTSLYNMD